MARSEIRLSSKSGGFTLVELMVVVAVVGLLAAFAFPVYQVYVAKSQVHRVVSELGSYKPAVERCLISNEAVDNSSIGFVFSGLMSTANSANIASFSPDGSGKLEVILGGGAHPNIRNLVVSFKRNARGEWRCVLDNSSMSESWSESYLPAGCSL